MEGRRIGEAERERHLGHRQPLAQTRVHQRILQLDEVEDARLELGRIVVPVAVDFLEDGAQPSTALLDPGLQRVVGLAHAIVRPHVHHGHRATRRGGAGRELSAQRGG